MEKLKICLTGSTGFIGKRFIENESFYQGYEIVPFVGDLTNNKSTESFFNKNKNFNQIIHLAGKFKGTSDELISSNLITTKNLLEQAVKHNIKKIIYTSSGAVYGEPINKKSSENDKLKPNTLYGLTKMFAEQTIQYFSLVHNIDYVILRFPNVYGPNNNKGVVYSFSNSIKNNRKITIYGDGKQSRNFLHVDDACQSIYKALDYKSSDIFNISTEKEVSINDLVALFKLKYDFDIEKKPANNNLKNLLLETEKVRNAMKWKPSIELIEKIAKVI